MANYRVTILKLGIFANHETRARLLQEQLDNSADGWTLHTATHHPWALPPYWTLIWKAVPDGAVPAF